MSTVKNKDIVRRYREIHNANKLDQLSEVVAPDLVSHSLTPGLPQGIEGAKMAHMGVLASFPDMRTETLDLIAEGDKVVERWQISATFTGSPMNGAPPNGKSYSVTGMSIYRLANGKIAEHWGEMDFMGVLQQLGLMPGPA